MGECLDYAYKCVYNGRKKCWILILFGILFLIRYFLEEERGG